MSEIAIQVRGLCKQYPAALALDDLSLTVPASRIVAIVGPDGSGKTTLLRILAGILDPHAGAVEIFGDSFHRDFEHKKSIIGYMPQKFGLYEDLTIQENIDFFADMFSVRGAARRQRIERLLDFSRLGEFTKRLAGNLSGGMKQKLGLACALIHNPKILLLDEPTNGVDPVSRREFWRLLYDLNREGATIVISSSYMDEAERADRFVLMRHGRVLSDGVPAQVQRAYPHPIFELATDNPRLAKARLVDASELRNVTLFGRSLHLELAVQMTEASLQQFLSERGIDVAHLRRIPPSFEDIYIGHSRGGT